MTVQNQRVVYGETLVELGQQDSNVVVLEADLSKSTMTCFFEEAFPERFFEMGIAEANMTSFAAGLSLVGKIPFTNSFAVFAAGRAFDQIRQGICIPKLNVKIVGSGAGLSDFGDGSTHQAIEDMAIMRAIPNMTVLVPADGTETRMMTREMARRQGPVYMRLTREDLPDVLPKGQELRIGTPSLVCDGEDAVVFACGVMVSRALDAVELLEGQGVSLRVVNVSTLKPVDETAIKAYSLGMRAIVTAEEHSTVGGLGSVVAETMRGSGVPLEFIGIRDRFGQSAHGYDELLDAYGLNSRDIVGAVLNALPVASRPSAMGLDN